MQVVINWGWWACQAFQSFWVHPVSTVLDCCLHILYLLVFPPPSNNLLSYHWRCIRYRIRHIVDVWCVYWPFIGSWLFCIPHLPCLLSFGACLEVVLWRLQQSTFSISSLRVKYILAWEEVLKWVWPQCTDIECSPFKFKHYLQASTNIGKEQLIFYAKQSMENHRGPTPDKKSHWISGSPYYCCRF